jgi:hypothetical protein
MGLTLQEPHQEPHANVLLYGEPKSGKTAGAASAPGRILYLNADLPNSTLYAHRTHNQDGRIVWARFEGMETLKEVGKLATSDNPGFDTLVLDPVGEAYRIMLEEQTNRAISNIDVRHYQFVGVQLERFCRSMCEADVNFVIVAHDRPVEDESNGTVERLPITGTKNPELGRKLMGMVDIVGYTGASIDEDGKVTYMAQLANGKGRHGGDRFDSLGTLRPLDLAEWFEAAGINITTAREGQKEKVAA